MLVQDIGRVLSRCFAADERGGKSGESARCMVQMLEM